MTGSHALPADPPTVYVTGAGGAVAPVMATAFLDRGWRAVLFVRPGAERTALTTTPRLERGAVDGRVTVLGADLLSESDAARAFHTAAERMGHCDALLNVAGGFAMTPAERGTGADLEAMLDVNLRTAVNATRAVLAGMLERGSGFVMAVGAGAALSPAPGRTDYAAAKAAVAAYFASLAAEVGERGVNVAVLHPMGTIDTPANRSAMPSADPSGWITREALADAAVYLATRPRGGWVHELRVHAR